MGFSPSVAASLTRGMSRLEVDHQFFMPAGLPRILGGFGERGTLRALPWQSGQYPRWRKFGLEQERRSPGLLTARHAVPRECSAGGPYDRAFDVAHAERVWIA